MRVAIITINDINNFGNRLQNYALQYILKKNKIKCENIVDSTYYDFKITFKDYLKHYLYILFFKSRIRRIDFFYHFNKKICYSKYNFNNASDKYDYFIVGSDQVWNPYFALSDVTLLKNIDSKKRISYSASFGVSSIPQKYHSKLKSELNKFKSISVRENSGQDIIKKITGNDNVKLLIDPTMLLTADEWDKVSKKPAQLDKIKNKKYILNYFLGKLSTDRKEEIEKIAKENKCHIINILDKKDPFYLSGPGEFLYLEKHAFLICTDSFHSSVFAILYNRPFIIFDREQKGMENMNSRIDTLINKFKLKNRKYNGNNITKENLDHDYSEAYKILEKEREKSKDFLEKALDIK